MMIKVGQIKRSFTQTSVLLMILGLGIITTACTSTSAPNTTPTTSSNRATQGTQKNVIQIGYEKYGTLNILKAKGNLEERFKSQGVTVKWI